MARVFLCSPIRCGTAENMVYAAVKQTETCAALIHKPTKGEGTVSGYHPAKGGNPSCRIIAWSRAAPINGQTEQIGEGEIFGLQ